MKLRWTQVEPPTEKDAVNGNVLAMKFGPEWQNDFARKKDWANMGCWMTMNWVTVKDHPRIFSMWTDHPSGVP